MDLKRDLSAQPTRTRPARLCLFVGVTAVAATFLAGDARVQGDSACARWCVAKIPPGRRPGRPAERLHRSLRSLVAMLLFAALPAVAHGQCGNQFEPCCTTGSPCNSPALECLSNICQLPIVVCEPGPCPSNTPADTPTVTPTPPNTPTETPTETPTPSDTPTATPTATNGPLDCSHALAVQSQLWPPNHKLVSISISGVTDPDGDSITLTVTGITQDEALKGLGSGQTCPDALGVGTSTAQVRAERDGTADGRVYHIGFQATDSGGESCAGTVTVCVPHDQSGRPCIDEGPLFDSTGPC